MDRKSFKGWREGHNLTQAQAGALFGVSENTIRRWELGTMEPTSWTLVDYAIKGRQFTHGIVRVRFQGHEQEVDWCECQACYGRRYRAKKALKQAQAS